MITAAELDAFLQTFTDAQKSYPFKPTLAVYKIGDAMFALLQEDVNPVRISLRCDPQLAQILRDKYETILPGQNLNPKQWNTVICSGQLTADEVFDLIRHAHYLVSTAA